MRLNLKNWLGVDQGWVDWNPETGDVDGPLSQEIKELAELARIDGFVLTMPPPGSIKISDPLKSKVEFAALIGMDYMMPKELAPHYPKTKDPFQGKDIPDNVVF